MTRLLATCFSGSEAPRRATDDEQLAIDAARLDRMTKHDRIRNLLQWIVKSKLVSNGSQIRCDKQIRLADALEVTGPWLSGYMNGKDGK